VPRIDVRSAGSTPADEVHANVVAAMGELGIDLEGRARLLTVDDVQVADVVVTMGCGDACPVFPGAGISTGSFPIPPGAARRGARDTRRDRPSRELARGGARQPLG
jgi:protein-tyrosine-phosphatase